MPPPDQFRVALATDWQHSDLTADDRLLLGPLADQGMGVEIRVWDDPRTDWRFFDAVVIRSCWDYHLRVGEFLAWLERLRELEVAVWNSVETIVRNHDKHYLRDFEEVGIDVVPTLWIERGSGSRWSDSLDAMGWDQIVVKPTVSASAHLTHHFPDSRSQSALSLVSRLAETHHLMIQPYVPEIATLGEWSFLFLGGEYSHAVLKRPAPGDFRVQHEFGGRYETRQPTAGQIERAASVLRAAAETTLYARVDMVDRVDVVDGLRLVELELIEPVLFFSHAPDSPARFARALRTLLGERDIGILPVGLDKRPNP